MTDEMNSTPEPRDPPERRDPAERREPPEVIHYARVWPRAKAVLVDALILVLAFLVAAVVGARLAGAGPVAFIAWVAVWALYDPLMVSLTGGTVGHHLQNLRVVSDRTGRAPSFPVAFVRNVAKAVLGAVSLLGMTASSRSKALHDWIAGTTVQARDVGAARSRDFTRVRWPFGESRHVFRVGGAIPADDVRVIGADGASLGVMKIGEAMRRAAAAGLDLVEVNRRAVPPVCKIMDRRKLAEALAKKAGAKTFTKTDTKAPSGGSP
jgi:uncharacterized RDD family membrane protein YckC